MHFSFGVEKGAGGGGLGARVDWASVFEGKSPLKQTDKPAPKTPRRNLLLPIVRRKENWMVEGGLVVRNIGLF